MKKGFLFISVFFFKFLTAQPILNGSFESWSIKNLFNEPNGFTTSNMWTYMSNNAVNVKKAANPYHGIFAAKLETISTGKDTMPGMLLIGNPANQAIEGGIPFTGTPDSVSGYIKKSILPGDTANFIVFFKNNGTIVGMAQARFTGIKPNYERFIVPVTYFGGAPDTMALVISSSNMDPPRFPGSTITIDSISFTGSAQPFPNGSFEFWTAVNTDEPNNWATLNYSGFYSGQYSAVKSTDSYDASYAMRLKSVLSPLNDTICFITNGKFGDNGPEGGMAVSANPQKISGYYKYYPSGPDTALAIVTTFHYDQVNNKTIRLDSILIPLTASNTYSYFEIPLTYNLSPGADTVNITFSACNMKENAAYKGLGSILLIDKININYFSSVGTTGIPFENPEISVFPNPSDGSFTIYTDLLAGENNQLEIYNILGEIIFKQTGIRNPVTLNLDVSEGFYFFKIISPGNRVISDKITIEK